MTGKKKLFLIIFLFVAVGGFLGYQKVQATLTNNSLNVPTCDKRGSNGNCNVPSLILQNNDQYQAYQGRFDGFLQGYGSGGEIDAEGCLSNGTAMWTGSCWPIRHWIIGSGGSGINVTDSIGSNPLLDYNYYNVDVVLNDAILSNTQLTVYGRRVSIASFTAPGSVNVGQNFTIDWDINEGYGSSFLDVGSLITCSDSGNVATSGPVSCTANSAGVQDVDLQAKGYGGFGVIEENVWDTRTITINAVSQEYTVACVVRTSGGSPISGAICSYSTGQSCSTNSDGYCALQILSGSRTITVTRSGYYTHGPQSFTVNGNMDINVTLSSSSGTPPPTPTPLPSSTPPPVGCYDDATIVSNTLSNCSTLLPGQTCSFDVTLRNSGTSDWNNGGGGGDWTTGYKFLPIGSYPGAGTLVATAPGCTAGTDYGHICPAMPINTERTWSFTFNAPSTPDSYPFQMQMIHASTAYSCSGGPALPNYFGQTLSSTITVSNPTPPPTVATTTATGVTNSTATLNGTVNPNGASTAAGYRWGISSVACSALPNVTPTSNYTGTSTVAITPQGLTGLTSGVTYYFCAVGTNSGGTTYGNVLSFSTTSIPSASNASVTVTNSQYCSGGPHANVTWSYLDPLSSPQDAYRVIVTDLGSGTVVHDSCGVNNTFDSCNPAINPGSNNNFHNIDIGGGLQFGRNYRATVQVMNTFGNWSPVVTMNQYCNDGVCYPVPNPSWPNGIANSWPTPVHAFPRASFTKTPPNPAVGLPVTFTDTSTFAPTSLAKTWSWIFTGGSPSSHNSVQPYVAPPGITYPAVGTYPVTLSVSDDVGSCPVFSDTVIIQKEIPLWQEIVPR